jgi:histidyl-tRNA synthetase
MKLDTKPYKGMRDFYPQDKASLDYIFNICRKVLYKYGYQEYDAPLIEPIELYLSKTSDEIVNDQTYTFTDRGGRKVVIRPEMTPSVNRMVAARRQELSYPLRLFSVPNLLRYEQPQNGRFREHWQLNVDLFGVRTVAAEIELILIIENIFQEFGADQSMFQIHINSRQLLDDVLINNFKINPNYKDEIIHLIDRYHKLSLAKFSESLVAIVKDDKLSKQIIDFLNCKSLAELKMFQTTALSGLEQIMGVSSLKNLVFDPTIVRGFNYYSDIVFEVYDADTVNSRAMAGGGRYNDLIKNFGVESLPTVGFGLGDASLSNFLKLHNLRQSIKNQGQIGLLIIGDYYQQLIDIIEQIRSKDLSIVVNFSNRKINDQLKWALKNDFEYVIIVGEQEINTQSFTIKNLVTKIQQTVSLEELIAILSNQMKS